MADTGNKKPQASKSSFEETGFLTGWEGIRGAVCRNHTWGLLHSLQYFSYWSCQHLFRQSLYSTLRYYINNKSSPTSVKLNNGRYGSYAIHSSFLWQLLCPITVTYSALLYVWVCICVHLPLSQLYLKCHEGYYKTCIILQLNIVEYGIETFRHASQRKNHHVEIKGTNTIILGLFRKEILKFPFLITYCRPDGKIIHRCCWWPRKHTYPCHDVRVVTDCRVTDPHATAQTGFNVDVVVQTRFGAQVGSGNGTDGARQRQSTKQAMVRALTDRQVGMVKARQRSQTQGRQDERMLDNLAPG